MLQVTLLCRVIEAYPEFKEIYNELQRAISEEAIFYPFGTNLRTLVTNARVGGLEEAKFAPIYTFGDYSKLTLK